MPKITRPLSRSFPVHPHSRLRFCGGVFLALAWLALSPAQAQTTNYALGTTSVLVGPAAGSNSVVLAVAPNSATWTATTNATWLHLSPANQSGAGSTNVIFSYDANPSQTRSNTLTIAGQTLTVTQAGSTYVAAGTVTALVSFGLDYPCGLAVEGTGNVYIADTLNSVIKEWTPANSTVTTLVSSGLDLPQGVAADSAGHIYIADTAHSAIKECMAAHSQLMTLVSTGLYFPHSVAVDGAGNVYIADTENSAIKEWTAAYSQLLTLVSSGLSSPYSVAVDGVGNVYIADSENSAIKQWTAANGSVNTLVSSGLFFPTGVAVDGAGNVYIADTDNGAIKQWTAANSDVITLVAAGLYYPRSVAVDGAGNIYIADCGNNAIKELPYAFVDPTPKLENGTAGDDALPVVLPATANLLPPFAPTSDQSWLTITGVTNGVVSFAFPANPGPGRTAHICLLGQAIPVTQVFFGPPQILTALPVQGNGVFQFAFGNTQSASFTVLSATNLSLPLSNWTVVGTASNIAPELFEFTDPQATNPQRFYRVRSP